MRLDAKARKEEAMAASRHAPKSFNAGRKPEARAAGAGISVEEQAFAAGCQKPWEREMSESRSGFKTLPCNFCLCHAAARAKIGEGGRRRRIMQILRLRQRLNSHGSN